MWKLLKSLWWPVAILLTGLALINLTLQGGVIDWRQEILDLTAYYRELMAGLMYYINLPLPFTIPEQVGDAVLLTSLYLRSFVYGVPSDNSVGDWAAMSLIPILFVSLSISFGSLALIVFVLLGVAMTIVSGLIFARYSSTHGVDMRKFVYRLLVRFPFLIFLQSIVFIAALAWQFYL